MNRSPSNPRTEVLALRKGAGFPHGTQRRESGAGWRRGPGLGAPGHRRSSAATLACTLVTPSRLVPSSPLSTRQPGSSREGSGLTMAVPRVQPMLSVDGSSPAGPARPHLRLPGPPRGTWQPFFCPRSTPSTSLRQGFSVWGLYLLPQVTLN